MKKLYLCSMILFTLSCWSQNAVKDSLFLTDTNDSFEMRINYEKHHAFLFKNEKFVTSAFDKIIYENMNYFSESHKSLGEIKGLNPTNIYDIKEYLNINRAQFIDNKTTKYDSYKLMLHFDTFYVFIKKNDSFIEVVYVTSLAE